jgi:REase_DpnII-MboI/Uncharacterized protein conserved in bacteria (DUF2321)
MDTTTLTHDVMQVCRNGHVITDRLLSAPDQGELHCDRCGAATVSRCLTCGQELPGALLLPGPVPIGKPQPPQYCSLCGASFPWTVRPRSTPAGTPLGMLETLLRRVPHVARQLAIRQGDRVPFRVEDDRDLEDFMRALLALHWDDARLETRTPSYAATTRTDFLLRPGAIALTVKRLRPPLGEAQLFRQLVEDAAYYQRLPDWRTLAVFVYDPARLLPQPAQLEAAWSRPHDDLEVRCVIA